MTGWTGVTSFHAENSRILDHALVGSALPDMGAFERAAYRPAEYYGELAAYFGPIRALAWAMALMIALTVVFTGANALNTSVQDRINELATLRALGYSGGALVGALLVEALLLAACPSRKPCPPRSEAGPTGEKTMIPVSLRGRVQDRSRARGPERLIVGR